MEPLPTQTGRGTRLSLLAIGLLVLLVIVAFASRSGFSHHSGSTPSNKYTSYALTVFVILFVLMIPLAVYAFSLKVQERVVARNRKSFKARLIAAGLRWLALVIIVFVAFYLRSSHPQLLQHINPFNLAGSKLPKGHNHGQAESNPHFEWSVLWVALIVLAALGAYALRQRRNAARAAVGDHELSVAEDIAATINDAIDDLESEPDARRAVIAAYARMEGVLGRTGLQRRPSETAVEYLARTLLTLTSHGTAVKTLTGLFELAKFSHHDVDSGMKQEAVEALREIRDDLKAGAA